MLQQAFQTSRLSTSPRSPSGGITCVGTLVILSIVPEPSGVLADIYRHVDRQGVVHFTNIPKSGRTWKRIVRTGPGKAAVVHASRHRRLSKGRYSAYDDHIRDAATLYHLPIALIRAMIHVESDFDPGAVSRVGARGLMQLMPGTAQNMGVSDVHDPRESIFGGSRYLRVLANAFGGDLQLTIAAYHAGPGAVKKYDGVPPYQTTRHYLKMVLKRYDRYRRPRPEMKVIVLFAATQVACSTGRMTTPQSTVSRYVQTIREKRADEAYALLARATRKRESPASFGSRWKTLERELAQQANQLDTQDPNRPVLTATRTDPRGRQMTLVMDDDGWKITPPTRRRPTARQPSQNTGRPHCSDRKQKLHCDISTAISLVKAWSRSGDRTPSTNAPPDATTEDRSFGKTRCYQSWKSEPGARAGKRRVAHR